VSGVDAPLPRADVQTGKSLHNCSWGMNSCEMVSTLV